MSLYARIAKDFGSFRLDVELNAESGVLGLLGASGCGKSLTLRCIAGIERPDRGRIVLNDRVLFDSERKIDLPPQERRVGYLFQQYALFPNMTAEKNIAAGARRLPKPERDRAVAAMMERMQISDLKRKYPRQLSGGQQQRVALARILINEPEALLLDEPFSALDAHLRDKMEQEVMRVIRDYGKTTLLVSHSRDEVYRMADDIAVYNAGKIDAFGEKHELFRNPKTYAAAQLTGCKNFSRVSELRHENGKTVFFADDWGMELSVSGAFSGEVAGLRRHYPVLADAPGENTYEMEIVSAVEDPFEFILLLRRPGTDKEPFEWALSKEAYKTLPPGRLLLHLPDRAIMLLRE